AARPRRSRRPDLLRRSVRRSPHPRAGRSRQLLLHRVLPDHSPLRAEHGPPARAPGLPFDRDRVGQLFGVGPWTTAGAVTLAVTGAVGMAGGAVFARWRVRGWALALSVLLIGASGTAARLLAGKSENLMNVWLLAALLGVAVWGRGRRGLVAATALAFGA